MSEDRKYCCMRCGKRLTTDEVDSIEVNKASYMLCVRCTDTFHRRFNTFLARG